ncbi:SpoIIE family protein phosphatase [Flammeovirga aprica]|uniref:SpoIIE family protein phosphatase n=1 Tax=Flammeovirga aprica JL-4 TaxID=694437 RepID=A0A7X9XBU6_9BACT|nr:SpoIIE family protein phosphatase [Flammeovirga aprica]NME70964.1 SpoIIE family protein phosphatase [Flammeovirga aprica JL-4]
MKVDDLQNKIKELEKQLSAKDEEIKRLKESETSLADANVRIAELFMDLEDAQDRIIDQKNEIQQQNEELSEHLEELSMINEQLNIAQTLNQNLQNHKLQADIIRRAHEKVLSSIHYAQNIQRSIFPSSETLRNNLSKYFKIFTPKDLVGGDFYWSKKIGNHNIFVVADCTGHGVPGAFMTLITITLLDRFVVEQKIVDPKVLNEKIDEAIITLLKQEGENSNRDSVDMVIFSEDYQNKTVTISSAKRTYYRSSDYGELEVVKGDRYTVGDNSVEQKVFTNKVFDRKIGDRYYFFSDGVTDQFGGPRNKKLGSKNLIRFLNTIQSKPLFQHQSLLEDFLTEWMEDEPQIDDIIITGLEIS